MAQCSALLPLLVLLLPLSSTAQTPADTRTFSSVALNLGFTYPSSLHETDPKSAITGTHINILGVSTDTDPALSRATACLHPILLLKAPESGGGSVSTSETAPDGDTHVEITPITTSTVLLAELDIRCVIEQGNSDGNDLLTRMAETVDKTPGMAAITPPAWYNVGRQRIHFATAQGHPQFQGQNSPFTIFTMGLSANWNNHLLVWFFTSNNISMLDNITKSAVAFGRTSPAPLYPAHVGNGNDPAPQ